MYKLFNYKHEGKSINKLFFNIIIYIFLHIMLKNSQYDIYRHIFTEKTYIIKL